MTVPALIIIALVVVVGSCLQASVGFGLGMLAAPVVALVDPTFLPGSLIILAVLLSLIVMVRERTQLDLRGAGWALLGRLPGNLAGAALLVVLPAQGLAWLVAIVVLAGVFFAYQGWAPRPRPASLAFAGLVSGVMGTATSIGGPPMSLIWRSSSGPTLRGTMSAFFLVGATMSLVSLLITGGLDHRDLELAIWMVPSVLLGYLISRKVVRLLDSRTLVLTAMAISVVGALLLIVRQFS